MPIAAQTITYTVDGQGFSGHLRFDGGRSGARPCVLVAPTWIGITEFEIAKAEALAAAGYAALVIDMYGDGRRAADASEGMALMSALEADRGLLLRRIAGALDVAKALPVVNAARTAAIGFCLGGKCVLDLARSGADIRGIVSLHGVYDRPAGQAADARTGASILVLHGYDDPLTAHENVVSLCDELAALTPDWQVLVLGGTGHSFTNPAANAPERGMAFNARSNSRAWRVTLDFLKEIFV